MRTRASLALLGLLALLVVPSAAGADPSDVYVDYASDGKLECGHSRTDLEGLLTDASINEYGDPLMLTKLKLAVRRQLAVGCGGGGSSQDPPATQPAEQPAEQPDEQPEASEPATSAPQLTEAASADAATTEEEPETAAAESATQPETSSTAPEPETAARTEAATIAAAPTAEDDGDSGGGVALLAVLGIAGIAVLAAGGWLARRSLTRS